MARSKAKKGKKGGEMKKEQSIYHEIGKGEMSSPIEDPYTMEDTGRERE